MDGTLLNAEGRVSVRNRAALQAAEDAGIEVVIATGRRHAYAMRVLRDPDAWPVGDLVLRRACTAHGLDVRSGVPHLRPWRAYAATHLWEATWGQPAG